jgi:hypothetical protein
MGLADGGVLDNERREEDGLLVPSGELSDRAEPRAEHDSGTAVLEHRRRRPVPV